MAVIGAIVSETIRIDVPRASVGNDLAQALASEGLRAELVETDDRCAIEVQSPERSLDDVVHAIELYLADQDLPLVVQRANGGAVVRPAGD
jgi:hypothetical protein